MNRKSTHVQGEGCSKWYDPDAAGKREASHENSDTNITSNQEFVDREPKSMRRIKDAVFELANSNLAYPLSKETTMQMEARLREIFTEMHTPDHPPYAVMIFNTIEALKEEGGSNEASISAYIKSQYHDLPLAHESLLSHHLGMLSIRGEIFTAPNGCYMLRKSNAIPKNKQQDQKEKQKAIVLHGNEDHNAQEILSMKPLMTFIEEKVPMPFPPPEPQQKPIKRRRRTPKPKEEKNVDVQPKRGGRKKKGSQSNTEANVEMVIDVEKEEKDKEKVNKTKKRRGRPPKKEGPKEKKKEDGDMEKQSRLRRKQDHQLDINQDVGVEKVFYGPKKRRGRPPKAKKETEPAAAAEEMIVETVAD